MMDDEHVQPVESSPVECDHATFLPQVSELRRKGAVLASICAHPDDSGEVALSYFFELSQNLVVVKTVTREHCVDSLFSLFSQSDFLEREASKLYRIKFLGHPNLSTLKSQPSP